MNVLVVGAGAREHALVWKLVQSPKVTQVFAAPGNTGTEELGVNLTLKVDDVAGILKAVKEHEIGFVVIGPEYPLSLGLADQLQEAGIVTFGPCRSAAQLECSKAFAKEIMEEAGVRTASHKTFSDKDEASSYLAQCSLPIVVKADGLAAGKGVAVCKTKEEALSFLETVFGELQSEQVLIEDFLEGREASYIVATDGERIVPFVAAHDYKPIGEGNTGPNTGGMGTVSPTPHLSADQEREALEKVIRPVLEVFRKRGIPFCGFLYAGLMVPDSGEPSVLEFNVRMGDPEGQVLLRRFDGDLFEVLFGLASKGPIPDDIPWRSNAAVCVVLAAKGYPASVEKGDLIDGIDQSSLIPGVAVFHAGTGRDERGRLITNGGRVLSVTAVGDDVEKARAQAYKAADLIQFRGRQMRRDIAAS